MRTEKGVIIAAYKPGRNPRFIVLKRKKSWEGWELPKGHLEQDSYRQTVEIELKEETGISEAEIEEIEETEQTLEWSFEEDGEKIRKEYKGYIVQIDGSAHVNVSENPCDEHEKGFFLRKRDVEEMLTYNDQKKFLQKVTQRLD